MKVVFHPEARAEFIAAINYYEHQSIGLGQDFAAEVFSAVDLALAYPATWASVAKGIRRCLVHRFPYSVVYLPGIEQLLVVAIMHTHRDPDYWQTRVN